MKDQAQLKKEAAHAALEYIELDMIVGVGTGSTVNYFIDALTTVKSKIDAVVSSSNATSERLKSLGFRVIDLNQADEVSLYVDGADEINAHKQMIKGGGGALLREKIVATAAKKFVCIVDQSKVVDVLGQFPVAIDVLPEARSLVGRELVKLGGDPEYRAGFLTDYGHIILDVYGLDLSDVASMESRLNLIPGVVDNGLFAYRKADVVLIGAESGVITRH